MKITTIKALREYLIETEALWTEEDRHFLGEFEDQEVRVPYFSLDGKSCFQGYDVADIHYDSGLGFIVQQCPEE